MENIKLKIKSNKMVQIPINKKHVALSIREADPSWCRIYLEADNGDKYVLIDGRNKSDESMPMLHSVTEEGEPEYPIYGMDFSIPNGKTGKGRRLSELLWFSDDISKFKNVNAIIDELKKNSKD